jgi:hypothetical protein
MQESESGSALRTGARVLKRMYLMPKSGIPSSRRLNGQILTPYLVKGPAKESFAEREHPCDEKQDSCQVL